jgi:hypothetical protein
MSLSAISSVVATNNQGDVQKAPPTPMTSHQTQASLPTDTVSLSPAAQKAVGGGDVDHDGDSH